VQQAQGEGGADLADHHTGHDQPHDPLGILGEKQDQQAEDGGSPDQLLQQFHQGGWTYLARPEEHMFMDIFHAGQRRAGDQQDQPQLGAGVPQTVD
jgi:hypothetical protein